MRKQLPGKLCYDCKKRLPVTAFANKRHRVCIACRDARIHPVDHVGALWERMYGKPPLPTNTASITTREGYNKYQRERNRMKRLKEGALVTSKTRPRPDTVRRCRQCKRMLPATGMAGPLWRLCLACDGPPLG